MAAIAGNRLTLKRLRPGSRRHAPGHASRMRFVAISLVPILSAIAIFSRYADGFERPLGADATFLALALRRLAELYDNKGDAQKALSYYARFVELWKNADPDLQPQVRKARARMAELQRRQG